MSDTAMLSTMDGQSAEGFGELVRSFQDVSARLEETHGRLRAEVQRLHAELRQANERLERSERLAALGQMAAGISHEVRNPLGSIGLYAKMLEDDLADRPAQREIAEKITRAVRGLDAIVSDVLNFSAELAPRVVPACVRDLFESALDECCREIGEIPVELDCPAEVDLVPIDALLARRALTNVIRNAVEAMADGGEPARLELRARACGSLGSDGRRRAMVGLSVSDTGPGIPREIVERMFNPFFTTRASGTGLGLAIVHRIVDAHGGCVVVSDRAGGRGSTVELQFPLAAGSRAEAPEVVVRAAGSVPGVRTQETAA